MAVCKGKILITVTTENRCFLCQITLLALLKKMSLSSLFCSLIYYSLLAAKQHSLQHLKNMVTEF